MDLMLNFLFSIQNVSSVGLELDIEHYVVPAPSSSGNTALYAANLTENPRSLSSESGNNSYCTGDGDLFDQPETVKT